ncbi:hypothetical protein [Nonomuraea soli]|uniref:Uncharacterized protein n=1 Tax=Nonomuraea soli TaxID=1032476 RepID=A0A7W0CUN6_9ACTN|nr:hypothetical protein [Nonomuraea soli]MBA2897673.1 hypothetical protein [Nonomuraea soli]
MANTTGDFDGEFMAVATADVRPTDVVLNPARYVADPAALPAGVVDIFRPADPARGCGGCDAGPGEPCGWGCLGLAALDDATGYGFADAV